MLLKSQYILFLHCNVIENILQYCSFLRRARSISHMDGDSVYFHLLSEKRPPARLSQSWRIHLLGSTAPLFILSPACAWNPHLAWENIFGVSPNCFTLDLYRSRFTPFIAECPLKSVSIAQYAYIWVECYATPFWISCPAFTPCDCCIFLFF